MESWASFASDDNRFYARFSNRNLASAFFNSNEFNSTRLSKTIGKSKIKMSRQGAGIENIR